MICAAGCATALESVLVRARPAGDARRSAALLFFGCCSSGRSATTSRRGASTRRCSGCRSGFSAGSRLPAFRPATLALLQAVWKLSLCSAPSGCSRARRCSWLSCSACTCSGCRTTSARRSTSTRCVVFACGALALSRAGDAFSFDALIAAVRSGPASVPHDSDEYTWPIRFVWVAMALIFCAAGLSKCAMPGSRGSSRDNFALTLLRQQYHISDGDPLTTWGIVVAHHAWLARAMAAAAIGIETLFPLTLFSRRARALLVPGGLGYSRRHPSPDGTDLRAVHDVLRLLGAMDARDGLRAPARPSRARAAPRGHRNKRRTAAPYRPPRLNRPPRWPSRLISHRALRTDEGKSSYLQMAGSYPQARSDTSERRALKPLPRYRIDHCPERCP